MSEIPVSLTSEEWQQVMNILIQSHPLLMKIAGQLRTQTPDPNMNVAPNTKLDGSGKEIRS